MSTKTIKKFINPPSVLDSTRQATLTSGTVQQITSVGGWYQVRAVNGSDSGACYAYIQSAETSGYIATNAVPNGNWNRAVTPYIYFPAGTTFWARAGFTLASDSGVYVAPEM